MSKVAIVSCKDYEPKRVKAALEEALDLIGGLKSLFSPEEIVLLKPNWVAIDPPEKCSITHPVVFEAALSLISEYVNTVTYGDSPAFQSPKNAAQKTGYKDIGDRYGASLADFTSGRDVRYEEGLQNKKLHIAKGVLDADALVSLPKLKTHGFQKMTGAIKNQFGCVPGTLKGEMHVKLPSAMDFSKMLVDLNHYINPRLYIMDGIMAMEGNGPRGGSPKHMGVLMVSTDPVALDATICRMVGLDPGLVPTTKYGQEVGMGTYEEDQIQLLGDGLPLEVDHSFDVDRQPIRPYKKGPLAKVITSLLVPKPKINDKDCVKCGVCVLMCPVAEKAVNWSEGDKTKVPVYDYNKCIRCYCCQELCPESAIDLDIPPLRKLLGR